MALPYRILLSGVDVSAKVASFSIEASLESYCREAEVTFADPSVLAGIDLYILPDAPALSIFTRADLSGAWVPQGTFFVERPIYKDAASSSTAEGVWGRSKTALLGSPFAAKVTKTWTGQTSFFAICQEMCNASGVSWDSAYSEIPDFVIYPYSYQSEGLYPIAVISELVELAYGPSGLVTTDGGDHLCIRLLRYAPQPGEETATFEGAIIASLSREPEWPEFGNRIRVSASAGVGGIGVEITVSDRCLAATLGRAKLLARVTDEDGAPMDGIPVAWSTANGFVALDYPATNTQQITTPNEKVKAQDYYSISVTHTPASIVGVWTERDKAHADNLAADGYTLNGKTITLTRRLAHCDQSLVISYIVGGVAINYATAGATAGTETVTADAYGNTAAESLYVENPCQCPPSITLKANPSSIKVGESARLITYVEAGGAPVTDGRLAYNTIDTSPHGHLAWTSRGLGTIDVTNEETSAVNEIAGITQCDLSMHAASVVGIWQYEEDEEGNKTKTGANLYSDHSGKTVDLSEAIATGTPLLAEYAAPGGAVNVYIGYLKGTDRIRALVMTTREEPTEVVATITVSEEGDDGDPEDCCSDGLCNTEESPCDAASEACEDGKIWCKSGGAYGCNAVADCDDCGVGRVWCFKSGVEGCWDNSECDAEKPTGGEGKIYCRSRGRDGCYQPVDCVSCGAGVMCYKDGVLGCYAESECDTGTGGGLQECPSGTKCCENKETGKRGCFESSQCSSGDGDDGDDGDDWDEDTGADCTKADGSTVKCAQEEACCEKGGVRSCWPWGQCDTVPDGCYTTDCQPDPNSWCLSNRFDEALRKYQASGCSCLELCRKEFDKYGTTQTYDEASYKTIIDIVVNRYGLTFGSPEFYEKYEELKDRAICRCLVECDPCWAMECEDSDPLVLSGPAPVTSPGGYTYSASGGLTPGKYHWSVSGAGTSYDPYYTGPNLYVTLNGACGAFNVSVSDWGGCAATSLTVQVINAGQWIVTGIEGCDNTICDTWGIAECTSGDTRTTYFWTYGTHCPQCSHLGCPCPGGPCPDPSAVIEPRKTFRIQRKRWECL